MFRYDLSPIAERSFEVESFNIAKNFALDAQGRIILMDLGELYSSEAAIKKQIQERIWSYPMWLTHCPKRSRTTL